MFLLYLNREARDFKRAETTTTKDYLSKAFLLVRSKVQWLECGLCRFLFAAKRVQQLAVAHKTFLRRDHRCTHDPEAEYRFLFSPSTFGAHTTSPVRFADHSIAGLQRPTQRTRAHQQSHGVLCNCRRCPAGEKRRIRILQQHLWYDSSTPTEPDSRANPPPS